MSEIKINVSGNEIKDNGKMYVAQNQYFVKKISFAEYISEAASSLRNGINNTRNDSHYYRDDYVPFCGRGKEIKFLCDFCFTTRDKLLWTAVTGPSGAGKSRLVYEFIRKNCDNLEWDYCYIDWKEYRIQPFYMCFDASTNKNTCIVIDYFSSYAKEIGEWLGLLYTKGNKGDRLLRIILIERQNGNDNTVPIWEKELLESDINVLSCRHIEMLSLSPLGESECYEIAVSIWKANGVPILIKSKFSNLIYKPVKTYCVQGFSINILLMCIEAMSQNKPIDILDFRQLQEWWVGQEAKRIKKLCKGDNKVLDDVERILFYANIYGDVHFSEIEEKDNVYSVNSQYLHQWLQENSTDLSSFFSKVCNQNCINSVKSIKPDVLGEFLALKYYQDKLLNRTEYGDGKRFKEILHRKELLDYMYFIIHCIQDYRDVLLQKFEELILIPSDNYHGKEKEYLQFAKNIVYFNGNINGKVNHYYYEEIKKLSINRVDLKLDLAEVYVNMLQNERDEAFIFSIKKAFPKYWIGKKRKKTDYKYVQGLVNILPHIQNKDKRCDISNEIWNICKRNKCAEEFMNEAYKNFFNWLKCEEVTQEKCDYFHQMLICCKRYIVTDTVIESFDSCIDALYLAFVTRWDRMELLLEVLNLLIKSNYEGNEYRHILILICDAFENEQKFYDVGRRNLCIQLVRDNEFLEKLNKIMSNDTIAFIGQIFYYVVECIICFGYSAEQLDELILRNIKLAINLACNGEKLLGTDKDRDFIKMVFIMFYSYQIGSRKLKDYSYRNYFKNLKIETEAMQKYYKDVLIQDMAMFNE